MAGRARGCGGRRLLGRPGLLAATNRGVPDRAVGGQPGGDGRSPRYRPGAPAADRPADAQRGPVRDPGVRRVRRPPPRDPRRRGRRDDRLDARLGGRTLPGRARERGTGPGARTSPAVPTRAARRPHPGVPRAAAHGRLGFAPRAMSEEGSVVDDGWAEYYDEYEDREPRELLLRVLEAFGSGEHRAVDLGCGSGIDTLAMLRAGWQVFATDAEPEGILRVRARVPDDLSVGLSVELARMEDVELPPVDLVWAGFSLFFCSPDRFSDVWSRILAALRSGGRFAGQLLGERDTWAPDPTISSFSTGEAQALFEGLEIEEFEEQEGDGDAWSAPKHRHL